MSLKSQDSKSTPRIFIIKKVLLHNNIEREKGFAHATDYTQINTERRYLLKSSLRVKLTQLKKQQNKHTSQN